MLLNPSTLKEIRTLEEFVKRKNGDYQPLIAHNRLDKVLEEDANFHSTQLEFPVLQLYSVKSPAGKKRAIRRATREAAEKLRRVWAWAKGNYKGISESFIQGVAVRVNQNQAPNNRETPYRTHSINVSGSAYTRTNPEKIGREVKEVVEAVQKSELHPVEAAAYAHFNIVRIHPFEDGNGRTSRIVQNVHLVSNDLPPVLIHRGEREFYNRLIEEAVGGHRLRTALGKGRLSEEEQKFYEFIGSKVLIGLEGIARQKYTHKH